MVASRPPVLYLDASAIVKLVVRETETDALLEYLGDAHLVSSEVAAVEVPRAAYLKTSAPETIPHAESLLRSFYLVALNDDVRRDAARAVPKDLRTLDAIHLASALRLQRETDAFVAYDHRLSSAARAAGFSVESPGSKH